MIEQTHQLSDKIKDILPEVVKWRRYLHEHPELSYHEVETAQFVYETLQSFGNIELSRPARTSVVGVINGRYPGKTLAIRADIDALPIKEENTLDYASKNDGVMHACGHDGHTAMLLGTAKILSQMKDECHGNVKLIFQHAEELFPGGAEELVETGVMDNVDWVIGTHLWSPLEYGKIGIVYGPMMASPDTFYLTIEGKGGHAAMPHQTIDSIAVASQTITNLQHIVARNIDPLENLVISVTKFIAGTTHNVIPGSVDICGTVRSLNPELREMVPELMERVIKGVTEAHGAAYTFKYERGYRPVINDQEVTKMVEDTVREVYGDGALDYDQKNMAGEDFSAYQNKVPGAFFYVGAGNKEKDAIYPHHHARFNIDEAALEKGINIFVRAAHHFLSYGEEK
ncbi:amidohydrolase [Scopulibacillus darangshiensis]|uniref:Amidohydrolase n=1 Tax=Scopulibacillus darangshiensis TaxID=442528 RepID=A0A4R2P6L5_9BACL|nr:M20 family metallopeptidase [Scopulibacillus darangshiensis]TCP30492.1 amidohydrolase [Scopulibacillus darangshiensis]